MNGVLKNYRGTIAMIAGVIAGAAVGALWPSAAHFVKPVGDIFLNLLFALVVPMVFFSISLAFFRMKARKQIGSVLLRTLLSFAVIWLCCGIVSYLSTLMVSPLGDFALGQGAELKSESAAGGNALTDALSVSDFPQLFSKFHLLPLIIFSALIGLGAACAGEKGERAASFFDSGNEVVIKAMKVLMYAAPLGLGCYFADTIAVIGSGLLEGYLRILIIYCVLTAILLFIIFPLIVRLARGRESVRPFFTHIIPPTVTGLATASSSVAMPGNIEAAEKMGIDRSVAQSVVPLATNLLKGGSVALDVIKVVFLMTLCGQTTAGLLPAAGIIGTAILSALVSGAVTNGGVTGELLICSLLGVRPEMAGIIMIIGTIADIPATLVNSQSTVVAAAIVDKKKSKDNAK
ncbi:MAG: dicarboxylate/amino acid:cation symporter [Bacteroidia bacterium]|nr:dicarboxylate/amino acid:cation symporter [Bacteroidia bacterium]